MVKTPKKVKRYPIFWKRHRNNVIALILLTGAICLWLKDDPAEATREYTPNITTHAISEIKLEPKTVRPNPKLESSTKTSKITTPTTEVKMARNDLENSTWMGWTFYESGAEDSWVARGDEGHAYGRYQFDDRFLLADFFHYCVQSDYERYEPFTALYYVDDKGKTHLRDTERIEADWKWMDHLEGENFHNIQTKFMIEKIYQPALEILEERCGQLKSYSPVLHGTIMSIAIRDGYYSSGLRAILETYYDGIPEEEWLQAIYDTEAYLHSDEEDYNRWAYKQKAAALTAYVAYSQCMSDPNNMSLMHTTTKTHGFERNL